jgi:hypothetical protein
VSMPVTVARGMSGSLSGDVLCDALVRPGRVVVRLQCGTKRRVPVAGRAVTLERWNYHCAAAAPACRRWGDSVGFSGSGVRIYPALGRSRGAGDRVAWTWAARLVMAGWGSRCLSDAPIIRYALRRHSESGEHDSCRRIWSLPCLTTSTRCSGWARRRSWRFRSTSTCPMLAGSANSCCWSSTAAPPR